GPNFSSASAVQDPQSVVRSPQSARVPPMRRSALAVLLLPAFAIALAGQTAPQKPSRGWKQLEAPGLTVMGNAGADELRRTATSILRFRAAMRSVLTFVRLA